MAAAAKDKGLRYLGLAAKAGKLVTGAEECEKAVKAGKGRLLLLAGDAGNNVTRLARRLAAERGLRLILTAYLKSELAAAVGRGSPVALALINDEGLAAAFVAAVVNAMEQEEQI